MPPHAHQAVTARGRQRTCKPLLPSNQAAPPREPALPTWRGLSERTGELSSTLSLMHAGLRLSYSPNRTCFYLKSLHRHRPSSCKYHLKLGRKEQCVNFPEYLSILSPRHHKHPELCRSRFGERDTRHPRQFQEMREALDATRPAKNSQHI